MVAMNLPGAQVAAVASKLSRKNKPGDYLDYGLAARFAVTVGELEIGSWFSCSGLGIMFDPVEIKAGGRYDEPIFAAGRVTWKEVSLERALERDSHAAVDRLLNNYTQRLVNWDGDTAEPLDDGQSVVITLLDRTGTEPIATWTLHNALIKSWSGPELSGSKNEVAVEKLVFVHCGFLDRAAAPPKVTLKHEQTKEFVEFDYIPEQYNVSQGVQTDDASGVQYFARENHVTKVNDRKISLNKLRVSGIGRVESAVNTLFEWLIPEKSASAPAEQPAQAAGVGTAGAITADITGLKLSLGQQRGLLDVAVSLREVKVEFTRFNTHGTPICAEIDLTLVQTPSRLPFLNPTSGGRTDNRAHLLSAGDNLQRIAQDTYHNPNAWRMIAATNDIDDPLRVRVGNSLLLPGTAE